MKENLSFLTFPRYLPHYSPLYRETGGTRNCAWSSSLLMMHKVRWHVMQQCLIVFLRITGLTKRCNSSDSPELMSAATKASEELHFATNRSPPFPQDLVLQIRIVGRFLKFFSILGPLTWSCLTTVLDSVLRGTRAAIRVAPGLRRTAQSRRQIVFCFRSILKSLAA